MEIRIMLTGSDPPMGRLRVVDEQAGSDASAPDWVEFTGWLGLLHALDEATRSPNHPGGAEH